MADYLRYIAFSAPFLAVSTSFSAIVRSVGSPRVSMGGMMLGAIVNIILDPIMILVLEMGVVGAAAATLVANIVSALYYIIYLLRAKTPLSISPKQCKVPAALWTGVLTVGVPGMMTNLLMSLATNVYNVFLAGYGDIPVAAMGIVSKVAMFLFMTVLGLTMGVQPLIGYCYGQGNYSRLKAALRYTFCAGFIIGLVITSVFLFAAEPIVSAFIDDPEVIALGIPMLRIQVATGPFIALYFLTMASAQAMGKALFALILSLCRQGLAFIPSVILMDRFFGLEGLIYAQLIADAFTIICAVTILSILLRPLKTNRMQDSLENQTPS